MRDTTPTSSRAERGPLAVPSRDIMRQRGPFVKFTISVAAIAAGLSLVAGTGSAKLCTTEIESLEKTIASSDAGMGPTNTGERPRLNRHQRPTQRPRARPKVLGLQRPPLTFRTSRYSLPASRCRASQATDDQLQIFDRRQTDAQRDIPRGR